MKLLISFAELSQHLRGHMILQCIRRFTMTRTFSCSIFHQALANTSLVKGQCRLVLRVGQSTYHFTPRPFPTSAEFVAISMARLTTIAILFQAQGASVSETSTLQRDTYCKVTGDDHATVQFGTGVHLPYKTQCSLVLVFGILR